MALVVEGPEAITVMRTLMGKTNARESAPGTIRGDLGASRQMNLIHGSDGPDAAQQEIATARKREFLVSGQGFCTQPLRRVGSGRGPGVPDLALV